MGIINAQQLHVENYTPSNGLLDTRVIKIFQDNRGLIYFLTWEGISIFDGQRFENISEYNGESLGLVNDMIQWKGDTCYVFTFQKGAYKLVHGSLIKDTAFDKVIEPNHVLKTGDNNWIITSNIGLFSWNGISCKPLIVQPSNKQERDVDFAAAKDKHLIYSKEEGKLLYIMNLTTNTIADSIKGNKISGITGNNQTNIFILINGKWMQLNNEALQKGKLKSEPLYFTAQLPPGFITNHLYVTENRIWLEDFRNRYILFNTATGEKETYPPDYGITSNASVVFTDKENNTWFGIFSKQVQKAYYTKLKRAYPSSIPSVSGLLNDDEGNAIAQWGRQLYILKDNPSASSTDDGGGNPFYWQERSWVFKTVSLIQSNRGDIIDLRKAANTDSSFIHSSRISFDKSGRLLICGNSLYVVEKTLQVHAAALPYFTDNIATDEENNYWAFTRNGTIVSYSLEGSAIHQKNVPIHINNFGPRFAIHWNADTFCIGTRHQGIIWLTIKNGTLKEIGRLNTSKGLSNNFASCLVKKNSRLLYAATEFGLDEILINGTDTIVQNLGAANNLYLPFSYVIKNKKEEIFARSNDNQFWAVAEKEIQIAGFIPSAWFNEITVNGKAVAQALTTFNYNQNNFRFTVTAPCFTNAANMRFDFLLENAANKWQQQSTDNFYSINNLAPGNYTLTVTVNYPGKIYPDKKIRYAFTINSPLWKRWWFIASAILLSAIIFGAVVRSYYRRKLATQKAEADKQQAVEKERNRISRDMHDDLGSGLTKIAILSEVAKKQLPEPEKAKEQLEKISESSRELVDNLQDIIWVLNPRNDTLESLSAYIREYALKYFEPLAVKISFKYPEEFLIKNLSEEKRRNIFLTVKESLHNIAKHAWCNEITIFIKELPQQFEIIIRDDGKGFESDKVRLFANGLKNMQNRIEHAGGKYKVESEKGKGTITTISMPV